MNFEIPTDFTYLWRYMLHMYQLDAFTQSCPADQDIINHYKLQQVGVLFIYISDRVMDVMRCRPTRTSLPVIYNLVSRAICP